MLKSYSPKHERERSSCRSSKRTGVLWNRAEPSQLPMNLWGTMGSAVHRVPVALKYRSMNPRS